jgi:hypothetical protein
MEYAQHLVGLAQGALLVHDTKAAKDWLELALMAVPGKRGQRKGKAKAMAIYIAVALDQLNGINSHAQMGGKAV